MIRTMTLALTGLALAATTAWAQGGPVSGHVTGTVSHIDPATRTIYLVDGRMLRLEPGVVLPLNGREVSFETLKRGSNVSVVAAPASQNVAALPDHPPVDVSGTVARMDRQSGVITLQDGRMVKMTDDTLVWLPGRTESVLPGAEVYIRNAQPVVAVGPGQPSGASVRMGTVVRVDPANAMIMLHDGTFVRVAPTTTMRMADTTLTISELRPGDEVLIRTRTAAARQPSATVGAGAVSEAPSALPRQDAFPSVVIDADDIRVVHRTQAP
jgi:hypothetical protein